MSIGTYHWLPVVHVLEQIITDYYSVLMDTLMLNCHAKAGRMFKGRVCNPYASNAHFRSTISSMSLGVKVSSTFKGGLTSDHLYSRYNKLALSERVLNISNKIFTH